MLGSHHVSHDRLLIPGLTLQTHVEGAPFNLDSSGVSMVLPFPTVDFVWVHHGREGPMQLSNFSDSLEAIPGSAVSLSLVEHDRARQAAIGIRAFTGVRLHLVPRSEKRPHDRLGRLLLRPNVTWARKKAPKH